MVKVQVIILYFFNYFATFFFYYFATKSASKNGGDNGEDFDSKSNKRNSSENNSDNEELRKPLVLSSNFSQSFEGSSSPFIYKVFQLPRDRTKVFWIYPAQRLHEEINEAMAIFQKEDEINNNVIITLIIIY